MSTRVPLRDNNVQGKRTIRAEASDPALYRRLVRLLLPAEFWERYGEELVWVFSELLMEARTAKGSRGRTTIWLREMPALLELTWRVRTWGDEPALRDAPERDPPPRR